MIKRILLVAVVFNCSAISAQAEDAVVCKNTGDGTSVTYRLTRNNNTNKFSLSAENFGTEDKTIIGESLVCDLGVVTFNCFRNPLGVDGPLNYFTLSKKASGNFSLTHRIVFHNRFSGERSDKTEILSDDLNCESPL